MLVVLLLALAAALRLNHVLNTEVVVPLRADARQYVFGALSLLNHGVYSLEHPESAPTPSSFRPPGYPCVIALFIKAFGERGMLTSLLVFQALLGAVLVLPVYALARGSLGRKPALVVAALCAFSPHLISLCGYVLTETIFSLLLVGGLLAMTAAKRGSWGYGVLTGVLFGAAYFLNEQSVLILPLLVLYALAVCLCTDRTRPVVARVTGFVRRNPGLICGVSVFLVCPLAWSIRNAAVVPAGANSGRQRALNTFTHGSYPGFVYESEQHRYFPYREDPEQPEFAASPGNVWRVLSKRVAERPWRYLSWYLLEKPLHQWRWSILQGQGDIYVYPVSASPFMASPLLVLLKHTMRVLHPALVLLALLGSVFLVFDSWRRRTLPELDGVSMCLLVCAHYTVLGTVFAPWPRYAVPLRPELYLMAVWGAAALAAGVRRRSTRAPE